MQENERILLVTGRGNCGKEGLKIGLTFDISLSLYRCLSSVLAATINYFRPTDRRENICFIVDWEEGGLNILRIWVEYDNIRKELRRYRKSELMLKLINMWYVWRIVIYI